MKRETVLPEEMKPSKCVSLCIFKVILTDKNLEKLKEYCGDLVWRVSRVVDKQGVEPNAWEIMALLKNCEKMFKRIAEFYRENNIRGMTKDGRVKFITPFGRALSPQKRKKLGFEITPYGTIFASCAKQFYKSKEPVIPPEQKDFLEWDQCIDKLLSAYTEKKQVKLKKWLELTVPQVRNCEFQ